MGAPRLQVVQSPRREPEGRPGADRQTGSDPPDRLVSIAKSKSTAFLGGQLPAVSPVGRRMAGYRGSARGLRLKSHIFGDDLRCKLCVGGLHNGCVIGCERRSFSRNSVFQGRKFHWL